MTLEQLLVIGFGALTLSSESMQHRSDRASCRANCEFNLPPSNSGFSGRILPRGFRLPHSKWRVGSGSVQRHDFTLPALYIFA